MKILAIDSSGLVASIAVIEDDLLVAEYTINYKKTHSQTLLPMLEEMAAFIELDLQSLDAIAVAGGPGSFTGLRIGAATAKGLGLTLKKPLIAVPTIDAIAYNLCQTEAYVCPILDARRNQTYTGLYSFEGNQMKVELEQRAVDFQEIQNEINQLTGRVIFLGDGVPVFRQQIEAGCTIPYDFAPAHLSNQRAGALGTLAMQYLREGRTIDAAAFTPDYLRLSQAERERMERETSK